VADTFEGITEILRGRKDFTSDRDPFERRLDSLARLLSGKSECVAVLVIDQKLYIAANEFKSNTTERHETLRLIKEVTAYFKDCATQESIPAARHREVFIHICQQK